MVLRGIVLVGIGVVIWLVLRRLWPSSQGQLGKDGKPASDGEYRRIVACQQCGVHIPADEAISRDGEPYCCRAHLP